MINTRSTYYRTVELEDPLTSLACDEYTMNIYTWRGFITSVPVTPTYSITRKNYEASTDSEDVEIGRLIKSYIDANLTDITTGADYITQNLLNQRWVKTDIQYDGGTKTDVITIMALYGYGYGNEGLNPQIPSDGILITNRIFKASRNTLFTIPVYTDSSKDVVITTPGGTYSNSYTIASTTSSDSIIQLITIDTSIISDSEDRITVTVDTIPITILFDDDERYNNTDLYFLNKYGAQQTVSMRKERSENMTISKEKYERAYLQPADGYHQNVDFNVQGKTSIRLSSGYIPEQNNLTFKELLLSDKVWMSYEGETTPVNIKSTNIDYKTKAVDKLINYEIEVSQAYNEINTI